MNKNKVDKMITMAYEKLQEQQFMKGGKIPKECQSRLASFGAAIATKSLLASISAYIKTSDNDNAKDAHGAEIIAIVWDIMRKCNKELKEASLIECVMKLEKENATENLYELKMQIKDAAVAVKLAMNFFERIE